MTGSNTTEEPQRRHDQVRSIASAVLADGQIVEMVYRSDEDRTQLCVFADGQWKYVPDLTINGQVVVPYSPTNNLIRHGVVLFPSEPCEYGTEADLIRDIRAFVGRYVQTTPVFDLLATYYVLLSWVYDSFNELPYLRVRGDPGSGKTRFLLTIGSVCYRPIFASGASTVSPLFRIIDLFQGTLILDESDFRLSDERAEIVKILNNGNARGFPVLRSEATDRREYNPRAYTVFGPKVLATRGLFQDRALESRCLTEEMGHGDVRDDIPINLPDGFTEEARDIRNKLLLFRFRNRLAARRTESSIDRTIEPRLNQVFAPLLSLIQDPQARAELQAVVREYQRQLVSDRGMSVEGQVLEVIRDLMVTPGRMISVQEITSRFSERFGAEYERRITPRWMGSVLRARLHLKPQKSQGLFVLPPPEVSKVERLLEKYGVAKPETKEDVAHS